MSFQQGVSGLTAAGRNLDVIGNNVANASTIGAKASRAEFADVYARASGGSGTSLGLGVAVAAVAQQFSQGSITSTENPLDVAINGAGFFQVEDMNGTLNYTRNGQFRVDRDGYVSNAAGMKLVAIPEAFSDTQIPGKAAPLQLPTAGIEPKVTGKINLEINLDARSTLKLDPATGTAMAVDFSDATTYNNSTSINVYDAKGQVVSMTYFFQKSAADSWNVYAAANGESVLVDGAGAPLPLTAMTFPADGSRPHGAHPAGADDRARHGRGQRHRDRAHRGRVGGPDQAHPVRLALRPHRRVAGRLSARAAERDLG